MYKVLWESTEWEEELLGGDQRRHHLSGGQQLIPET